MPEQRDNHLATWVWTAIFIIGCWLVVLAVIFGHPLPDYSKNCKLRAQALHLQTYNYSDIAGCIVYYKGGYTEINNVGKYR